MDKKEVVNVVSDLFTGFVYLNKDSVQDCCPALQYMKGWSLQEVIKHCIEKKWKFYICM